MDKDLKIVYARALAWKGVNLTEMQNNNFIHACKLSLQDNETTDDACIAARVYLNFILRFPDIELPPLNTAAQTHI